MMLRSIAGTTASSTRVSDPYPRVHGQPYKATSEVDAGGNAAILGITQVLLLAGSYFTPNTKDGHFWLRQDELVENPRQAIRKPRLGNSLQTLVLKVEISVFLRSQRRVSGVGPSQTWNKYPSLKLFNAPQDLRSYRNHYSGEPSCISAAERVRPSYIY
jgi:hypothetical protein